jgi:DNA adenine methylase
MISPIAYIGGKRRLAPLLASLFPPHVTYVEAFCGGAQVFFRKPMSRVEVLNDLSGDVANFLRICREHPEELVRTLRFLVPSRAVFAQFAAQAPALLTDVQRAARFLYLQKNAFSGLVVRRNFHYCVTRPSNFNPATIPRAIREAAKRLERVQVESLPYQDVLERYDRTTTFVYLDPPYIGAKLYEANFNFGDFEAMATRLGSLRGRFLLSINDHPLARTLFRRFNVRRVSVPYTSSRAVPTVDELVVANYSLPPVQGAEPTAV